MILPGGQSLAALSNVENEIEPRSKPVARFRHAHQQLGAEQAIAAVHRLVWKIQLRREQRPLRRLHLHVVVARASRVERRQNGAKTVAPLAVREQMAAIAETAVVVFAALVGVPQIDECVGDRPARAGEHVSAELDQSRLRVGLHEICAFRRTGLEKGSLGLSYRSLIAIVTLRGGRQALRNGKVAIVADNGDAGDSERIAQNSAARSRHDGLPGSVPIPKFANPCGSLECELRVKGTLATLCFLVPLLNPKFANGLGT